jgi:hypothetical protein
VRVQLADLGIRVSRLHVGYMDTGMVRTVAVSKSIRPTSPGSPAASLYEIVADDAPGMAQSALSAGVSALYRNYLGYPRCSDRLQALAQTREEAAIGAGGRMNVIHERTSLRRGRQEGSAPPR